jgi:hypothetical protein
MTARYVQHDICIVYCSVLLWMLASFPYSLPSHVRLVNGSVCSLKQFRAVEAIAAAIIEPGSTFFEAVRRRL